MQTNTAPKFKLVLVTHAMNGKMSITVKATGDDKDLLQAELQKMKIHAQKCGHEPDYRVCDPVQFKKLQGEVEANHAHRRAKGREKAAKTRAQNIARGKKPRFICCPLCKAKSQLLYSELGGLQTRKCQNGHTFEYDKWMADRAFWGPIFGSGVPYPYRVIR